MSGWFECFPEDLQPLSGIVSRCQKQSRIDKNRGEFDNNRDEDKKG